MKNYDCTTLDEKAVYDNEKITKEEMELSNRVLNGDDEARNLMIERNLGLVYFVAKKYFNRKIDAEDVISIGKIGLINAVDTFDPHKGYKFSTYATMLIKQEIYREINNYTRSIKIPSTEIPNINLIIKSQNKLIEINHREPSIEEISNDTGLPLEKVSTLLIVLNNEISLDKPIGSDDNDSNLYDFIYNDNYDELDNNLDKNYISKLLSCLPPESREILEMHYGINRVFPLGSDEIATSKKIPKIKVRKIEADALRKIRIMIKEKEGNY